MTKEIAIILLVLAPFLTARANKTNPLGNRPSVPSSISFHNFDEKTEVLKVCVFPDGDGSCKNAITFILIERLRHRDSRQRAQTPH